MARPHLREGQHSAFAAVGIPNDQTLFVTAERREELNVVTAIYDDPVRGQDFMKHRQRMRLLAQPIQRSRG